MPQPGVLVLAALVALAIAVFCLLGLLFTVAVDTVDACRGRRQP